MTYQTRSEADTMRFAAALGRQLDAGDVLLLEGDLGAGKSVVARGVARALGIAGAMPSPTFTLLIPYEGEKKLYHFDLYRLADPDEFWAAGLDEFVSGDGIAVIEWPQMAQLSPERSIVLRIARGEGDDDRVIELENCGVPGFDEGALAEWRRED
ncbi:MAG TPA: tRNA (adenosine(37)-N6)-threonylcarbamoyltransferase complex ATPase subunit type 1 TsaE [Candidatus Faecivicinus avistercoris]|nr:tRNA (adenosine(37)-N6)-threonylcarbamoyltransferase complex ATPase subunit type 1 TsaE [Candidatus Faecivicinus avistercoris]